MLPPSLPYLSAAHAPWREEQYLGQPDCVRPCEKGIQGRQITGKNTDQQNKISFYFFKNRCLKGFALWGADFLKMPTIMCLCVSVRMGGWIKWRQKVRMVCVREIETERWLWVVELPVESKVGVSGDWLLEQWWFVWKGLPSSFSPPPSLSLSHINTFKTYQCSNLSLFSKLEVYITL